MPSQKDWSFHPLWGLCVTRCEGLADPIFGDATIVSRDFITTRASPNAQAAALISGGGFKQVLEQSGASRVGSVDTLDLVEKSPGCFIAVNRKKAEDAQRYAQSIRAFLTGTYVKSGGAAKGFSMDPRSMFWSAIPDRVWQTSDGRMSCNYRVSASNHLHLTPVTSTQEQLRTSWSSAGPAYGTWSISKSDALADVLIGNLRNKLHMRIRDACIVLSRAMESSDSIALTLFGAVALETLLGGGGFSDMEAMATCLFSGDLGPEEIAALFTDRHKLAHQAIVPESDEKKARQIFAAWAVLFGACEIARAMQQPSTEGFMAHLRGRVEARALAGRFRQQGANELADNIERQATQIK